MTDFAAAAETLGYALARGGWSWRELLDCPERSSGVLRISRSLSMKNCSWSGVQRSRASGHSEIQWVVVTQLGHLIPLFFIWVARLFLIASWISVRGFTIGLSKECRLEAAEAFSIAS